MLQGKRFFRFFFLLIIVNCEQVQRQLNSTRMLTAAIGVVLLLLAIASYIVQLNKSKEVVQFQSFEITNPPTPNIVSCDLTGSTNAVQSAEMKEVFFDSNSDVSPSEKKKRKRKAHRLSDRRRNQQAQEAEEIEQSSEL